MIYLARRNPALAAEDFPQAWREHSALGRQCKNVQDRVRSVTQCVQLLPPPPGTGFQYDGVNLLGLRDRESADAIWTDPETLAIMRPDEPRVFDRYVRDFTLVNQEHVVQDGPLGDAVLVGFLKRRADIGPDDFRRALERQPSPWPGARRTVLNLVEPQRPPGYDFDAILEWWFEESNELLHALTDHPISSSLPAWHQDISEVPASVFLATRVTHRRP